MEVLDNKAESIDVLVISSKYFPEYSGSGHRAQSLYRRLKSKFDINYQVICNSVEFRHRDEYKVDGIDVRRIVTGFRRYSDFISTRDDPMAPGKTFLQRIKSAISIYIEAFNAYRVLRSLKYDVVHIFGRSPSTTMAIRWCRKKRIPFIVELVNRNQIPYQYLPGTRMFDNYRFDTRCVLVAISKELQEVCESYGEVDNVWVRPNPIDKKKYHHSTYLERSEAISDMTPFEAKHKIVTYIANFRPQKNHIFMLDVIENLPEEFKLILGGPLVSGGTFGAQSRSLVDKIRREIKARKLSGRVDLKVGFLDMSEYLKCTDVFCFPARNEALGTPMIESLAAGVPVIANVSERSFNQWIQHEKNGFLCPLKDTTWAEFIERAMLIEETQRVIFSQNITKIADNEVIDRSYFSLLQHLKIANRYDKINVSKVLNQSC